MRGVVALDRKDERLAVPTHVHLAIVTTSQRIYSHNMPAGTSPTTTCTACCSPHLRHLLHTDGLSGGDEHGPGDQIRDAFRYPQGFQVDGNPVYLPKIRWHDQEYHRVA